MDKTEGQPATLMELTKDRSKNIDDEGYFDHQTVKIFQQVSSSENTSNAHKSPFQNTIKLNDLKID